MHVVVWRGALVLAGPDATRRALRRDPKKRDVSCIVAQWRTNTSRRSRMRRSAFHTVTRCGELGLDPTGVCWQANSVGLGQRRAGARGL